MDAASDKRGQQIVRCHQMKKSKYSANQEEWAHAMKLLQTNEGGRHPGENHAEIGYKVQQARNERGEKRKIQAHGPEKCPARKDKNQPHERGSHHVAAQHIADFGEGDFYGCPVPYGK